MMGEVEEATRGKRYGQRRPVNGDEADRQIRRKKKECGMLNRLQVVSERIARS
jgi:hypothetical protein